MPSEHPPRLELRGVSKRFGPTLALDAVSLAVEPGEFLTLLGGSGCGKTTLLRIVAGFTRPDAGMLWRDGRDITDLPPAPRRIGFVFQSYALFPTKTVAGNIGFALAVARQSRAAIAARVRELAALIELAPLLNRYPHELSGGQQQRVALARALASSPDILLLDEPLSALDARIRARLRDEIRAIVDRLGITAIYVTHDQEEALALSDRIAIMRDGRIEQLGTPAEVYHRPGSRFVAEFVGVANLVDGRAAEGGIDADGFLWPAPLPAETRRGAAVTVLYRPEHVALVDPAASKLAGEIEDATFLGSVLRLRVVLDSGRRVVVDRPSSTSGVPAVTLQRGVRVGLRLGESAVLPGQREHA